MTTKQISDIEDFIHDNIYLAHLVRRISEKFQYSKSFIHSEFRRIKGVSISDYILDKKMEMIREDMECGMPLYLALKELGFSQNSGTYYTEKYFEKYGESPQDTKRRAVNGGAKNG